MNVHPKLVGDATQPGGERVDIHCGREIHLRYQDVQVVGEARRQIGDVALDVGDDPRDSGNDAEAVGTVQAQHEVAARRFGRGLGLDVPDRGDQPTVGSQRRQGLLHRGSARFTSADERHGEVSAQPRHGRIGEVEAETGEDLRHIRDDPRPVVADHGNGELVHARIIADGRIVAPRPSGRRTESGSESMRSTQLADRAIRWYAREARDLPWRRPGTTPWGVLVSEVMLQQTPAARVAPVWLEWQQRWPTPRALAAESPAAVIRAWGRLGYPRRALRLHECAVAIVEQHDGSVPSTLAELLRLPGIGTYTARAVATFAFGQRHPVVDTNVRRLVARAVGGYADGGGATTTADLDAVEALLPRSPARAAKASAAFMELGAVVCTARRPACGVCPLRDVCAWRLAGHPVLTARAPRRPQRYAGTDRQVRGVILALARASEGGLDIDTIDAAWPDAAQRRRALVGLLEDGLLVQGSTGRFYLPGDDEADDDAPGVELGAATSDTLDEGVPHVGAPDCGGPLAGVPERGDEVSVAAPR